jgi:hypothetical protein
MSIKGFNNQKGLGNSEFLSVLSGGSDKKAIPTLGMGVYPVLAATAISSVTRSTDEKTLDIDFGVATSARKGDILRMVTGTLPAWEFEIIIIVSANVVRVWNISPSLPLATETASILRPVTLQLDSSGNITVTPAAGGATEAKQDAQIVLIGGVTEARTRNRYCIFRTQRKTSENCSKIHFFDRTSPWLPWDRKLAPTPWRWLSWPPTRRSHSLPVPRQLHSRRRKLLSSEMWLKLHLRPILHLLD